MSRNVLDSRSILRLQRPTKGCGCNKSVNQLHDQFEAELGSYELDPQYREIIKDVMVYTYDYVTQ